MIDIATLSTGLRYESERGFWVPETMSDISYPAEGNAECFAVEDESFWFGHRNDVLCRLVRSFSPAKTLFDIGGGNGCVARAAQSAGTDVVLVEPGLAGVVNARKRGIRTIVQASLEDAEFRPGSLPSVGLFDVIEHLENDEEFLRTIHACLEPGGYLYLTVPAYGLLWSADDEYAGHFRRYTSASLRTLLSKAGFDVVYHSYFFSFLVAPIFLTRTLPSLWRGKSHAASMRKMRREHTTRGVAGPLVRALCRLEAKRVEQRRRIPFGSSCIMVATKAR